MGKKSFLVLGPFGCFRVVFTLLDRWGLTLFSLRCLWTVQRGDRTLRTQGMLDSGQCLRTLRTMSQDTQDNVSGHSGQCLRTLRTHSGHTQDTLRTPLRTLRTLLS